MGSSAIWEEEQHSLNNGRRGKVISRWKGVLGGFVSLADGTSERGNPNVFAVN